MKGPQDNSEVPSHWLEEERPVTPSAGEDSKSHATDGSTDPVWEMVIKTYSTCNTSPGNAHSLLIKGIKTYFPMSRQKLTTAIGSVATNQK